MSHIKHLITVSTAINKARRLVHLGIQMLLRNHGYTYNEVGMLYFADGTVGVFVLGAIDPKTQRADGSFYRYYHLSDLEGVTTTILMLDKDMDQIYATHKDTVRNGDFPEHFRSLMSLSDEGQKYVNFHYLKVYCRFSMVASIKAGRRTYLLL